MNEFIDRKQINIILTNKSLFDKKWPGTDTYLQMKKINMRRCYMSK